MHSSKLVFHLEKRRRTRDHFAVACEFTALICPEFAVLRISGRIRSEFALRTNSQGIRRIQIEFAANLHPYEVRARTEAELAALEAEKARLQQAREAEAARAREEAERRAAAATAATMEEAETKLQRETPPGGSRVETL